MANFIADDWDTLSPLLDEVLALDPGDRRRWLDDLARMQPARAAAIESLLDEHRLADAEDFLGPGYASAFAGAAGQVVGGYTLVAPLGEGGMGSVWMARRSDGRFEAQVAVKFLAPGALRRGAEARFRREGNLLAQLTHRNVARLIDAGITGDGQPYLVLEYVDGERIDAWCRNRGLGIEARVNLFLDVLSAVAEAHQKLIVHRDIKPSNVFVGRDGVVKLIDFGIAKLQDDAADSDDPLTREGAAAFTPEYAAPEQLRGEAVTTRTDVYSLGLLLFELLAGVRPFDRGVKLAFAAGGGDLAAPLPSRRVPPADIGRRRRLEGDLDNIVAKALRVAPAERYSSVEAFADDLRRHLANEPVTARADTFTYRAGKFVRRHRGSVAAGTVVALALVLATLVTTLQTIEAQRQRDMARLQLRRAEASSEFVTSLLSQAGPGGRGLLPVELLDRGMDAVRERYGDDPDFAVDMLLLLSGRYMDLGRTDREYQALLDAESLARRAGEPATLLNVLCNTVETELTAGRRNAAEARMQEARRLLGGLRDVEPVTESNCLRQEAALLERDDITQAIANLERARQILEAEDRVHGNLYASLFSWLSAFNRTAGHYLAAHRYHEQDVAVHARQGHGRTVGGRMARAMLANSWYRLGEVQRAVAAYEAEAAAGTALLELHPIAAISYGLAQSAMGRHGEALRLVDHGVAAASAAGQQVTAERGRYARAVVLLRSGRIDDAEAALEAHRAAVPAAAGVVTRSRILALDAEIRAARGELRAAADLAGRALVLLGYPDSPRGSLAGEVLTLRSRILTASGDPAAAIADAEAALSLLQPDVVDPERSATVGAARLALAEAELLAGDTAAGRRDAAAAHRALAGGLGAAHPRTTSAAALTRL